MIITLSLFYLMLCYFTQTFQFNPRWGWNILILGAIYDIAIVICKVIGVRKNEE